MANPFSTPDIEAHDMRRSQLRIGCRGPSPELIAGVIQAGDPALRRTGGATLSVCDLRRLRTVIFCGLIALSTAMPSRAQADTSPSRRQAQPSSSEAEPNAEASQTSGDGPTPSLEESREVPEDPMADVWSSIRKGDAHVAAAEYDEAIVAYQYSLDRLANAPEWAIQLRMLQKLLATAHLGSYRVGREPKRLRRAKELLEAYRDGLPLDSEDRHSAARLISEITAQLASAEASARAEQTVALARARKPSVDAATTRMLTSGIVVGSVGLLAIGPAVAGLTIMVQRWRDAERLVGDTHDIEEARRQSERLEEYERAAERMGTMGLISAIAGAATVTTGVVLTVVAQRKRKSQLRRSIAGQQIRSQGAIWPQRRGLGLSWSVRF